MSAVPLRLLNGHSPLQTIVSSQERGKPSAQNSSSHPRKTAKDRPANGQTEQDDLDAQADGAQIAYVDRDELDSSSSPSAQLRQEEPRDPRDDIAFSAIVRPASPYTLNPPIDFDGLSWPSESTERCTGMFTS